MAQKQETRLQRRIKKALISEVGGFWFKVHGGPFQQAGLPDLIGCTGGMFFGIEVKTDEGELSDIQIATIDRINKEGGGHATCVTTPEEAVTFVQKHLRAARRVPTGNYRRSSNGQAIRDFLRTRLGKNLDNHGRTRKTRL